MDILGKYLKRNSERIALEVALEDKSPSVIASAGYDGRVPFG